MAMRMNVLPLVAARRRFHAVPVAVVVNRRECHEVRRATDRAIPGRASGARKTPRSEYVGCNATGRTSADVSEGGVASNLTVYVIGNLRAKERAWIASVRRNRANAVNRVGRDWIAVEAAS